MEIILWIIFYRPTFLFLSKPPVEFSSSVLFLLLEPFCVFHQVSLMDCKFLLLHLFSFALERTSMLLSPAV